MKHLKFIIIIIIIFFTIGCSSAIDNNIEGNVQINICVNDERTIIPEVGSAISEYRVSFFSGLVTIEPLITASRSISVDVPPGTWDILVEGLNTSGQIVASGSENGVIISSSNTTVIPITLTASSKGLGSIDVTVDWFAVDSVNISSATAELNGSAVNLIVDLPGKSISYSDNKASGSYILIVHLEYGAASPLVVSEAIQVFDNLSSSATIYLDNGNFNTISPSQIIADHAVVDQYDQIPSEYLAIVKTMLVDIAGESHSSGYRIGMDLLELYNSNYESTTYDGTRPAVTTTALRVGRHGSVGEEDFYTSTAAKTNIKGHIQSQYETGNPYHVLGFGWCWDFTWQNNPGGTLDPVYQVRWAGSSSGGPDGNLIWGLDIDDEVLTGNSVSMQTYLNAVEEYITYCETNSLGCTPIFTTGPVDGNANSENGFQRELKHDYIRNYVRADSSRILFDYADILCYNNSGEENIATWNDNGTPRTHSQIHPDNMMDYDGDFEHTTSHSEDGDHIGEVGAMRLAKAMWWMLARIAGWDGN